MLKKLHYALERPNLSRYGFLVQKIILLNILLNIFSFVFLAFFEANTYITSTLNMISKVTVIIFIFELLARYVSIGENKIYKGIYGRIKYTFTFYIIIDIISLVPFFITSISADVMLIRFFRFFRFFRLLKLLRMKKFLKKFFSINSFASSTIAIQAIVLFSLSIILIFIFSYAYNSVNTSILIFTSPSNIIQSHSTFETIMGMIELVIGLFVGGALISIITSTLVKITNAINNGYLPFKEKNHIVIINYNSKLSFILYEINKYYQEIGQEQDIVIFLPNVKNIEYFKKNMKNYTSLELTFIAGDELNWNSYDRININEASKVIILKCDNEIKNLNRKITRFILTNNNFNNDYLSFIIETEQFPYAKDIYDYIFYDINNKYSLINQAELIKNFLNRSIVNHDYFKIFSELLSFNGSEFYTLNANDVFDENIVFIEAYMKFTDGILMGVIKDDVIMLNPNHDLIITENDKLIAILKNSFSFEIDMTIPLLNIERTISIPKVKETKNICIVGDYSDIKIDDITEFLTQNSINNFKSIIPPDEDYMNLSIWNELVASDIDIIILNLEDEYEFTLSLYLQSVYQKDQVFLSKIINILHDPINAKLLLGKENKNKIILSEELIGEYIAQVIFNESVVDIFNEITQSDGNEFYVLEKNEYSLLFQFSYHELKSLLINHKMIYIGAIIKNELIFNCKNIIQSDKIIVLTMGE